MQTKLSIFASKLIEAGWLAAVVAVPLFFNIYTARTFEPDKLTLMRSIVTVMILAWLIKLLEEGWQSDDNTFGERVKRWLKQPMALPTVLIVLTYLVSTVLSLTPHVSFWGSYQRLQGTYTFISYVIIFALMGTNMNTRRQVDRFITTVIITSVPVALYGIIQHNGLDPLPWAGNVTQRVASNMGNAIFVSSYLIMIVPVTLSRLIESMTAIITEERASWGHTVLSAVYIFVIAIQILTIIYSVSRGPQIGLLGALALMMLLFLLIFRQRDEQRTAIALPDISSAVLYILLSLVTALILGAIGYFIGKGIELALASNLQLSGASLIGGIIGGIIGFAGTYTYAIISKRGWRWLWVTWTLTGVFGAAGILAFLIALNTPGSPVANLAENNRYLHRMAGAINTDSGTGKVRVLIWEGAFKLISPHRPLGVEGEFTDKMNPIRPLIGYGPESMFNAFAFAYPPDLAHVENRGSSADRSHNETMDSLVMTGVLGFLAFYFLMGSLFYYALKWLGWVPNRSAGRQLVALMTIGAIAGAVAMVILKDGSPVLIPVGLPFGLFGGMMLYLVWRGWVSIPENTVSPKFAVLLIGLLGAFIGHFLEVHFVFSIAATYTYFWAYLGVMVALWRIDRQETTAEPKSVLPEATTHASPNARRKRKAARKPQPAAVARIRQHADESWEMWLGAAGLSMAIILIILTFDFVPVQFSWATGRYSLLWMLSITYLVGTAIVLADLAVRQSEWAEKVNWLRATTLYLITSLGYAAFYVLLHSQQRHTLTAGRLTDALQAAEKLFAILDGFYIALFLLMVIIAVMLAQKQFRSKLPGWRIGNWWLYPPLIAAAVLVIYFKNINVVKADTFLKEGDRYRSAQQWNNAIKLHRAAINADSDEDFYYLMLALDYQLEAQDGRLDAATRQKAWLDGEKIALEARRINIYNPDNTGNMGRYYFTLGQVLDPSYFEKAKTFFQQVLELAPQNVQYYNLLAQTYYMQGDYDTALDWLNKSAAIDSEYAPTWLQLGDTYAAKSDVENALEAHKRAIALDPASFADANFDSRLNFYLSAKRTDDLVAAFSQYITDHPGDSKGIRQKRGEVLGAIGHIYLRAGVITQANEYLQQATALGYQNAKTLLELADVSLQQQNYQQAETLYQQALQKIQNPNQQAQIWSSLGYIYAQTGRIQQAIDANNKVLQAIPNDYDSHKNLALLYQQTGQLDQAIAHAEAALNVAPENVKADLQTYIEQLKAAKGQ